MALDGWTYYTNGDACGTRLERLSSSKGVPQKTSER
jgi:hypothetical protein